MRRRLDRLWRAFGTGLFLAIIGLCGSALAMTVFPLIALATRDPERRRQRIQTVLHRSFRLYCRAIHRLKVADVRMEGLDRLTGLTGTMIIANHPSLLDVVMIMAAVPNVQCIVKGGLWRNPFFRLTVEGAGYIRNDVAPEALMRACVDTLKAGNNLIVFPEGTRTVRGRPMKLHRGFANIALMAGADLQLITIRCEPPSLHKGNPWWRVAETRTEFRMTVGERLEIRRFLDCGYRSLAARKLVAVIETYYAGTLAQARTAGVRDPDAAEEDTEMNRCLPSLALLASLLSAGTALARDDHVMFPLQDALQTPAAQEKLDPRIGLYFGAQPTPRVTAEMGEWRTNKKTNGFNKTDKEACEWVFLSAVLELQQRAREQGGNAVIGIKSNYKNMERSSETEYMCGSGALISGVAFKGKVVKLDN